MNEVNTAWNNFASNGPWAVAFAYLLVKVLQAWERDRASRDSVLSQFGDGMNQWRQTISDLKESIRGLTNEQQKLREMFDEFRKSRKE